MNPASPSTARARKTGFTLVELLIVLVIMVILFTVLAGFSGSATASIGLTTTGDTVYNKLVETQQIAIAKNKEIEVRFYEFADEFGDVEVRGIGFFEEVVSGTTVATQVAAPPLVLGQGYVISSGSGSNGKKMSTLVDSSNSSQGLISSSGSAGSTIFPPANGAPYTAFRFRANGATNLSPTASGSDQWHITLVIPTPGTPTNTETAAPANYYTIRLDPYTGRCEKWRP